jgi:hypothetical protein
MTYGQLLRKIASLSEEQLRKEINVRVPMEKGRWTIERVTVWDDSREDNVDADVDIFIVTK